MPSPTATHDRVAVRLLCADTHPDHDTICTFLRKNRELLARSFARVIELSARCGGLKVGGITVPIHGTKVLANASKHAAVSHGRAGKLMEELDLEIEELVRKAENADSTPLDDGLPIPAEVQRRQERKAKLAEARAEIEARAQTRAALEGADDERKLAARDATRSTDKKPRGKEPQPPSDVPNPKGQVHFTAPESRIMPVSGGGFEQGDNAQAAVEVESHDTADHFRSSQIGEFGLTQRVHVTVASSALVILTPHLSIPSLHVQTIVN
jgi:hypothetical protein